MFWKISSPHCAKRCKLLFETMFIRFSKQQHKEKFNEKFLLVFNSNEESLLNVGEAYKENVMLKDAKRLESNRADAA